MNINNILENVQKFSNIEDLSIFIKKTSNLSCDKFNNLDNLYNIDKYPKLKSYMMSKNITDHLDHPKIIKQHFPSKFINLEKYADKLADISHSIPTDQIEFTKIKHHIYDISPFEATQILVYQYISLEFCYYNKNKISVESKLSSQKELEETINQFYNKYKICNKINILYKNYILINDDKINIDNLIIYTDRTFENNLIILNALKTQYTFELHHRILWSFYCVKDNGINERIGHLNRPLILIERLKRINTILCSYNNKKLTFESEHLQLQLQEKEQELQKMVQELYKQDKELYEQDKELQEKDQELQKKERELQEMVQELHEKDNELQHMGHLIQIQNTDLHFQNVKIRNMDNKIRELPYNLDNFKTILNNSTNY
jgi:hypothetical protein